MKIGSIQGLYSDDSKIDIKFNVSFESHEVTIEFFKAIPNNLEIKNNLFITDNKDNKITFLDCGLTKYELKGNNQTIQTITIYFNTCLKGIFIDSFEQLTCKSLTYEIDSEPIPLLNCLSGKTYQLSNASLVFKNTNNSTGVYCILTPLNKDILVSKLETIFFDICDIIFLCLGSYPYIKTQNILYNKRTVEIFHIYPYKYIKGNSPSNWKNEIVSLRDIDLSVAYCKYKESFEENNIVIEVLSNVVHSKVVYVDLQLSMLIQCVEGYMRTWHKSKKFSDEIKNEIIHLIISTIEGKYSESLIQSIRGLLGNINSSSLKECLQSAFEYNDITGKILKKEKNKEEYKSFINKSAEVRNQFSHMTPKKKRFSELEEIIKAFEKYKLLLRVLILTDLKISPINIDRLISIIDNY